MIEITTALACSLIEQQFPQWKHLAIRPVESNGHDNRTFRLGDEMAIRLPSNECYVPAVEKEMKWLPVFKSQLSVQTPVPIAKGEPTEEYPLPWTINRWINGDTASYSTVHDLNTFAQDLARFLKELEAIDASNGVPAGPQNFHRGGDLAVYNDEAKQTIEMAVEVYDKYLLTEIWELSLASRYNSTPVWVHGDVATGNLLVKNGILCGVIDFGTMGVGDPSSDLVMAWTFFDSESRKRFLVDMNLGEDTINRARGWALWKALITYEYNEKSSELSTWGKQVIDTIIHEYKQKTCL